MTIGRRLFNFHMYSIDSQLSIFSRSSLQVSTFIEFSNSHIFPVRNNLLFKNFVRHGQRQLLRIKSVTMKCICCTEALKKHHFFTLGDRGIILLCKDTVDVLVLKV